MTLARAAWVLYERTRAAKTHDGAIAVALQSYAVFLGRVIFSAPQHRPASGGSIVRDGKSAGRAKLIHWHCSAQSSPQTLRRRQQSRCEDARCAIPEPVVVAELAFERRRMADSSVRNHGHRSRGTCNRLPALDLTYLARAYVHLCHLQQQWQCDRS